MVAAGVSAEAKDPSDRSRLVTRARRVDGAPVVAVRVWIRGGSRQETTPGQALVAGRLLAEGTRRRDWRRIAEEAEDRGLSIATTAGAEVQSVAVDALTADWRRALEWAAELTLDSVFPEERCRWVTRQTAAELASLADHPDVVADWAFRRQLYAPHPRARPLQGSAEALASIDAAACAAFHRAALADGVIVSIAGAIDPVEARRLARELFRPIETLAATPRAAAPATIEGLVNRQEVALEAGEQAHLFLGALTVDRADSDLAALDLLAAALGAGSGLVGRIPRRVREVEGLAYACRAATAAGAGLDPGCCEIYLATAAEQVVRAEAAVREELDRLATEPFPRAELEEARSYLLGCEPFRRETARQWAVLLAEAAFYGLPLDRPAWTREQIEDVEVADLERVAGRYLDPSRLKVTLATRK